MKIIVLMGSPNPKGSTSILVEQFRRGAEEGGHAVEDKGMVLGYGCGTPSMTQHSKYPQEAYRLGKEL